MSVITRPKSWNRVIAGKTGMLPRSRCPFIALFRDRPASGVCAGTSGIGTLRAPGEQSIALEVVQRGNTNVLQTALTVKGVIAEAQRNSPAGSSIAPARKPVSSATTPNIAMYENG